MTQRREQPGSSDGGQRGGERCERCLQRQEWRDCRIGGGVAPAATPASDSGSAGEGQAAPASGSGGATVVSTAAW
ncbi:hypothetical protein Scep_030148 [Stephania cephalantha]|uniref:Uncharacterized protein n=1 Tax=Stephania cephalantha TaxID=152367 RepID=A0AAP0E2L7_9MAGN